MKAQDISDDARGRGTGFRRLVAVTLASAALALSAGCGIFQKDSEKTANWSAQRLYTEAEDELQTGNYANAIKYFEQLQSRFPFGRYAQQAQMEIAYAQYRDGEKDLALAATDRFIKQYPNQPERRLRLLPEGPDQL